MRLLLQWSAWLASSYPGQQGVADVTAVHGVDAAQEALYGAEEVEQVGGCVVGYQRLLAWGISSTSIRSTWVYAPVAQTAQTEERANSTDTGSEIIQSILYRCA